MAGPELASAETMVRGMAARIGAPPGVLRSGADLGIPHVEYENGRYRLVVQERGEILESRETASVHQLLYWIFVDVTHEMAVEWEARHRTAARASLPVIHAPNWGFFES